MVKRIIIAGVGGQGILLASDILSEVCMEAGFDVKNIPGSMSAWRQSGFPEETSS